MGFTSWLTADTRESIPNVYALAEFPELQKRTVYLLQPGGLPPIAESDYEGYSTFGGITTYDWLVNQNAPKGRVEELLQHPWYGVQLSTGLEYYRDVETGDRFCVFHTGPCAIDPGIREYACSYATPLPGYGMSANDLAASGRIVRESLPIEFPLKFSFDPDARYEDLPASESCPVQGYFYGDEEDPEEDEAEDDSDDSLDEAA